MKLSSCDCAARGVGAGDREDAVGRTIDVHGRERRIDGVGDAALGRVLGEHRHGLPVEGSFALQQRHDHVESPLGRDVRREQEPGWRLVDPGLREAVRDQDGVRARRVTQS